MRHAILWGLAAGICAFLVNIIIPGPFELLADPLIVFLAMIPVTRRALPGSRAAGLGLGVIVSLIAAAVITMTDMLTTILLGLGLTYKDQIPWLNMPDMSLVNQFFGGTMVVLIVVFLCMGIIKTAAVLLGGLFGGWLFVGQKD